MHSRDTQVFTDGKAQDLVAPTLVFACGNPSRGDDALGPKLTESLQSLQASGRINQQVTLLTDFQFQIEHALDLVDRQRVLFVDASQSSTTPLSLISLQKSRQIEFTTHAIHPSQLLSVFERIHDFQPPPSFLLSIRAYEFELGSELSVHARKHLQDAIQLALQLIDSNGIEEWENCCREDKAAWSLGS